MREIDGEMEREGIDGERERESESWREREKGRADREGQNIFEKFKFNPGVHAFLFLSLVTVLIILQNPNKLLCKRCAERNL